MIELLTDKDFEWVGSLLKEMLDSPNAKAWNLLHCFYWAQVVVLSLTAHIMRTCSAPI